MCAIIFPNLSSIISKKMHGYPPPPPSFFLDSNSSCWDLLFPHSHKPCKNRHHFSKYQNSLTETTIFGSSCKRPPLVSGHFRADILNLSIVCRPVDTWSHLTRFKLNSIAPYNPNMTYLLMKRTCDPRSPLKILHTILGCVLISAWIIKEINIGSKSKVWPPMVRPFVCDHLP